MSGYKSILFITDLHAPYTHQDVIPFLKHLKKKYKPGLVIISGDEADFSDLSFHESTPELPNANTELGMARKTLKPLYKLFPKAKVLESNHGSMVYRKAHTHGFPKQLFKTYREILLAPQGWTWHEDLVITASDGSKIYFCHGKGQDVLKNSQAYGMSFAQGHHHNKFEIRYWGNSLNLYWGLTGGCLIDKDSLAFAYGKINLNRPVIGCAVIINGHPILCPLVMNKLGRWIGP